MTRPSTNRPRRRIGAGFPRHGANATVFGQAKGLDGGSGDTRLDARIAENKNTDRTEAGASAPPSDSSTGK